MGADPSCFELFLKMLNSKDTSPLIPNHPVGQSASIFTTASSLLQIEKGQKDEVLE